MATQKSGISPLRQRMIEDMQIRKFGEKTQSQNFRASLPSTSGAILTLPASQPKGVRDNSFSHAFLSKKLNDSDPFVSAAELQRVGDEGGEAWLLVHRFRRQISLPPMALP